MLVDNEKKKWICSISTSEKDSLEGSCDYFVARARVDFFASCQVWLYSKLRLNFSRALI